MPLHVARLRDSDLASEESAEACWYAVLLWAASWHQIPAASLPDNDAVLTKLIGLGKDVRTFRRHKAGAMRGYVLCSDGRLYHPVVAEQAVIAWNSKLQQRWRTECARVKKHNQRTGEEVAQPTFEEFLSRFRVDPGPQSVPRDIGECPQGQSLQETETGTGTGRTSSEDKSSGGSAAVVSLGPDASAWEMAILLLTDQGEMSEKSARAFFGRLLSRHGVAARDLFSSVATALASETKDPQGYLTKAAAGIARRRAEPAQPQKRVGFV